MSLESKVEYAIRKLQVNARLERNINRITKTGLVARIANNMIHIFHNLYAATLYESIRYDRRGALL